MSDVQFCVCGHSADDHEGVCLIDDCLCRGFDPEEDFDDEDDHR